MGTRPAVGGGRRVDVAPERLARWLAGFADRHGVAAVDPRPDGTVALAAPDGELAVLEPVPGMTHTVSTVDDFVAAVLEPRRIGLLLIRRGGIAAGIAEGATLTSSKVDTAYVQSRTAAGGWSQQRFARRRENQAKALAGDAVALAERILAATTADALVTGGDRRLVDGVLRDARLSDLPAPARHLDVPDPRLAVLQAAVPAARAVHITLRKL
jgi:hypothetical protein